MTSTSNNSASLCAAVVDDDATVLILMQDILSDAGFKVEVFSAAEPCLDAVRHGAVDFVFTDINMPGMGGVELLEKIKEARADVEVVMMTADARVDSAVQATRLGAVDYLSKPLTNIDAVTALARRVAARVLARRHELSIVKQHEDETKQDLRLSGRVEQTDLGQLIQLVADLRRDGALVIEGPPAGQICLKAGTIVDCELGALRGEKALYRLFCEASGTYRFAADVAPSTCEGMGQPLMGYILEGARHKDERPTLLASLPSLDVPWAFGSDCQAAISQLNPTLIEILANVMKNRSPRALLDDPRYADLDVLKALKVLWDLGAVKLEPPPAAAKGA